MTLERSNLTGYAGCLQLAAFLLLLAACADPGDAMSDRQVAGEPPLIPVGLDAYRMWDRWPYQRIGARAYMRSTYDRSGQNMDASNFLYQEADDFNVTLDVQGPGVLYFARYNHWHGSPWHYEVDGRDHIVQDSTTANPLEKLDHSVFLPEHLFPNPLTWTYPTTKGANLMWVPIAFEDRFRMAYGRTFYGTGYYIYHHYVGGAPLSRPIRSWDGETPPDPDVLAFLGRAGTDIAPQEGAIPGVRAYAGHLDLPADAAKTLIELDQGAAMIRALKITAPAADAVALGSAVLRITWDDREHASVEAPLALFFGAGTFYNRTDSEYLVKALPVNVRYADGLIHLACYLPMPFFHSAKVELVGTGVSDLADIEWQLRTLPYEGPPNHVGYLHATYVDHGEPELGADLIFLDTSSVEEGGDWTGSFIGTSFIFSHRAVLNTLEGDPRFYFDDSLSPQAYGTGTEEWAGGGDYWGGLNMTIPLAGHPTGVRFAKDPKTSEGLIQGAYRFLLADLMPFGKRAVITFEHGAYNDAEEHYRTVTYWYGLPGASVVLTDTLEIGDAASETAHAYFSPDASAPYSLSSRYEVGVDHEILDTMMTPLADAQDYADFEFEADADRSYYVWVRGRAKGAVAFASTWFQFDDKIGTDEASDTYQGPWGFAEDWSWAGAVPMTPDNSIQFRGSGPHRLRLQGRFRGHDLHQIWLSTSQSEPPVSGDPVSASQDGGNDEIIIDASGAGNLHGLFSLEPDESLAGGMYLRADIGPARLGREIFPAQTETGRKTTGASEFTLAIRPNNLGVMLRRTLDYGFPNQRARVLVRESGVEETPDWQEAGIWYLAGSNTNYASFPGMTGSGEGGELGPPAPLIQQSNRRLREDEFLIPRPLTEGRSAIRVRVEFEPVKIPLLPDRELDELAWSEIRYKAYSFVMPEFSPGD